MDGETREEVRAIHKRITDLEQCNDSTLNTITDTLDSIKESILGKLDGGDGLLPRIRRIESDIAGLKNHSTSELTAVKSQITELDRKMQDLSKQGSGRAVFSLQDLGKWKLFVVLTAIIIVGVTGGWPGLKWLMGVFK